MSAPAPARARAMARPIRLAPPVTRADWPERKVTVVSSQLAVASEPLSTFESGREAIRSRHAWKVFTSERRKCNSRSFATLRMTLGDRWQAYGDRWQAFGQMQRPFSRQFVR